MKAIVEYLNDRRICTRDGGRWGIDQTHKILTRTTYVGRHRFNMHGKGKTRKSEDEVITVAVPRLIDQATFDAVQAHLHARNPKTLAPRLVNSPNMLTGLLHCAQCGGLMVMRTGKAGRYRYYVCQKKAWTDTSRCTGITIPMDALDALVARHMTARLLDRNRLKIILTQIFERRRERIARDGGDRFDELTRRGEEVRLRLKRLLKAIEMGALSLEEPALQERLAYLQALQTRTAEEIRSLHAELNHVRTQTISPATLGRIIKVAEERLLDRGMVFDAATCPSLQSRSLLRREQCRLCVRDNRSLACQMHTAAQRSLLCHSRSAIQNPEAVVRSCRPGGLPNDLHVGRSGNSLLGNLRGDCHLQLR